jgi:hypothetical protein
MEIQSREPYVTPITLEKGKDIMEKAYKNLYGKYSDYIHRQFIFNLRETEGYPAAPERVKYYRRFPNNITVFGTVYQDGDFKWDGWLFHHEVVDQWYPGRDQGTYIIPGPLNPMKTFNPREAR